MENKYFFDIPIYFCSPKEYWTRREKQKNKDTQYYLNLCKNQGFLPEEIKKHAVKIAEQSLERRWLPWSYNQIIGYIRLFTFFDQIRGELWMLDKKRFTLSGKERVFKYIGKAFEVRNFFQLSNEKIYEKIITRLKSYNTEDGYFKKRYFDLENFGNVGPLIDYKKILDLR